MDEKIELIHTMAYQQFIPLFVRAGLEIDENELIMNLSKLKKYVENNQIDKIKSTMKQIVITYKEEPKGNKLEEIAIAMEENVVVSI